MKTKTNFSFIELLLVCATMAVLFSLITPSLKKIISSSKTLSCQNNLRRVITATHTYSDDFAGFFPYYHRSPPPEYDVWFRSPLRPYYQDEIDQYSSQSCPTSIETWSLNNPKHTYAINRRVSCDVNIQNITHFNATFETKSPSRTIAFLDGQEYRIRKGLSYAGITHYAIGGGLKFIDDDMIHNLGINTVFLDGHLENVYAEIFYGYSQSDSTFWNPLK